MLSLLCLLAYMKHVLYCKPRGFVAIVIKSRTKTYFGNIPAITTHCQLLALPSSGDRILARYWMRQRSTGKARSYTARLDSQYQHHHHQLHSGPLPPAKRRERALLTQGGF